LVEGKVRPSIDAEEQGKDCLSEEGGKDEGKTVAFLMRYHTLL